MSEHPWSLVAPWYHWPRQGGDPRATRPVLQKYETSKLVDLFRDNPQHSLRFTPEDLRDGERKLFLAQHKRFYLVVCELHCDRRGFPNARADEVCQAGFVLRRRRVPVPEELRAQVIRMTGRIHKRRSQLQMLRDRGFGPSSGSVAIAIDGQAAKREARAQQRMLELQRELDAFATVHRLAPVLEGWAPAELEGVGTWSQIEEDAPVDGDEHVFTLHRLIPDPKARPHAARGRSLYFGLVPTASSDTTLDGTARLDIDALYELQCFVRRHDARCPRTPGAGRDCCGELTWSAPTRPFRLASAQDLVGTSNRPVTVQLPNIPELLEQARELPFGAGAPLRMASPDKSSLPIKIDGGSPKNGSATGPAQICSFAIPLITIVAYFVFRLFLPIVVLLFGLWFLLKLRFCIPPSIEAEASLAAELSVVKGGASFDAEFEAKATKVAQDGFATLPGNGFDGVNFEDMGPSDDMPFAEYFELYATQRIPPTDPVFGYPPALPEDAVPSPNSALAPLIWERDLKIPELEEVA